MTEEDEVNTELILNMLAESAATDLSREQNRRTKQEQRPSSLGLCLARRRKSVAYPKGYSQSAKVAKKGGSVAKAARQKLNGDRNLSPVTLQKGETTLIEIARARGLSPWHLT